MPDAKFCPDLLKTVTVHKAQKNKQICWLPTLSNKTINIQVHLGTVDKSQNILQLQQQYS